MSAGFVADMKGRELKGKGWRNSQVSNAAIGTLASILLLTSCVASLPQSSSVDLPELQTIRVTFSTSPHEISGAALVRGRLHVVADGPDDLHVYSVREMGVRFELKASIDLGLLSSGRDYMLALRRDPAIPVNDRRIDFEGLCACGSDLYIANERARDILRVREATVERLPIDFSSFKELREGGGNTGFEGVAVDCKAGLMYIAKERSPRAILKIRMRDWKLLGVHDLEPPAPSAGTETGVERDFSDLAFDGNYLYVLERSARQIAKVDPSVMKVVARFSYKRAERGLYSDDERFGLAEGLALSSSAVIIALDNNGSHVSRAVEQRFGVSGNSPAIIHFKRPPKF